MKHHREEILMQREKALLPTRQPEAERRKHMSDLSEQIKEIDSQVLELGRRRAELLTEIAHIRMESYGAKEETVKREFIQPCPNSDCRGFLSTQWKCGMCLMWTCKDCHDIKGLNQDDSHECNPDKVASAKLIAEETKPCPKCGVRLFKISGCNQMWCTSCNDCAFDWVTGKIETAIHNPHYFEYQRRMHGQVPRQPGDQPCMMGGNLPSREINRHLHQYNVSPIVSYNINLLDEICRVSIHILHVLVPRYRIDHLRHNEESGISFLMGKLTEEDFKVKLQRNDKKAQMSHEILNVLLMCAQTLNDISGRYNESLEIHEPDRLSIRLLAYRETPIERLLPILETKFVMLQEAFPLLEYANECLEKIAKLYGSKSCVHLKLDLSACNPSTIR
jgi:hypothetical protein